MKKTILLFCIIALSAVACQKQQEATVSVRGVELDIKQATIQKTKTIALVATVSPANATNKKVSWESDNSSIASVSSDGVVTGVDNGTTTITVMTQDGGFKDECTIKVTNAPAPEVIHVTSVSLSKTEITIKDNESSQLTTTVLPENATDKSVTWTSDNEEIARVSSTGLVSGVDAGTANITATTTDGGFKASCKVNVSSSGTHTPKRPSGTGWTKTDVPGYEGLVLYNFCGTYLSKSRNINVVDVDTTKYQLKFWYNGSRYTASQILKNTKSIVSMNGAYEVASIFIQIDGWGKAYIENDQIGTTGVANWKNDGGVCLDKKGHIAFLNTIMKEPDEKGSGSYGRTLSDQRTYYRNPKLVSSVYSSVFSSAPLMIYGYDPVGLTFVPSGAGSYYNPNNKNSEDPYYHQSQTHPRTAIAVDGNGHILMITVDGRQTKTTPQRIGLSCKDFTQFMVDNFNPKHCLNMDGGGSTTLCIAGMGNADNVVNHPIDDDKVDQERQVSSFFYVVKK